MAKPKTAKASAKPRAKTKAKASGKRVKVTAEQLSDQDQQRLLKHHINKVEPLTAAVKMAQAAEKKAFDLAEKEGVPTSDIKLAIKLKKDGGAEAVQKEMKRTLNVARWMRTDIGSQLELFVKETSDQRYFEDGRAAALGGEIRKPPTHLSQNAAQNWMDGHHAGTHQINKALQDSLKPLAGGEPQQIGDVVTKITDRIAPNGSDAQQQAA